MVVEDKSIDISTKSSRMDSRKYEYILRTENSTSTEIERSDARLQ